MPSARSTIACAAQRLKTVRIGALLEPGSLPGGETERYVCGTDGGDVDRA